MKLTIVVDTDDVNGIKDSLKIVSHFANKHRLGGTEPFGVKYGKIAFVKMLRHYGKHVTKALENGEDPHSLRFAKFYADTQFDEQRKTL
jgi:hypothetical protein